VNDGPDLAPPLQPSLSTLLIRGLIRRCPVCGTSGQFRAWFRMAERCRICDLRFERIEGHWMGAIGINTVLSFGVLLVTLVTGLVVTFPEFPLGRLVAVNVAVAVFVPLLLWPVSRTFWTAIDIAMRPLQPGEVRSADG